MKLGTDIRNMSGHCWKGFQGQRSEVKVMTRLINRLPRQSRVVVFACCIEVNFLVIFVVCSKM